MNKPVKAPLLVTRCDLCGRRRKCVPLSVGWFCRQCIRRLMPQIVAALKAFKTIR